MRRSTAPGGFFRAGGVETPEEGLRRRIEKIVQRAAEAGFPGAARLWTISPAEVELELSAFAARRARRAEELDAAAWAAARYAAVGLLAPRRFPRRPELSRPAEMSSAEMKAVFAGLSGNGKWAGGSANEAALECPTAEKKPAKEENESKKIREECGEST